MKRSNLITGLIYLAVGIVCLGIAITYDTRLDSLLCGLCGAGIGGGAAMLYKYFWWNRPENSEIYQEKLDQEYIDLHDERKEQLRNRAGRYAYLVGMGIIAVSILLFYILDALDILPDTGWITIYLYGYLVVQYILGIIIYRWLNARY